jgi:hypothetical protein
MGELGAFFSGLPGIEVSISGLALWFMVSFGG